MKIVILPGSLRKGSFNKQLGRAAQAHLVKMGHEVDFVDLKTLEIPLYDGDFESEKGIPPSVTGLEAKIKAAHALVVVSPEYNGGTPGVLKNCLDWISRVKNHSLAKKPTLVMTASPGPAGGLRSSLVTKEFLSNLACLVYPEVLCLGKANEAFNDRNEIQDPKMNERLLGLLKSFEDYSQKLNLL